jgi:hypothetical protein
VNDFISVCGPDRSFYICFHPNKEMTEKFGHVFDVDMALLLKCAFKYLRALEVESKSF